MEDALNKMVAYVQQNIVGPDDASRTIHETAALLGLELEKEIPETTLIITGMRMKVLKKDVVDAFKEFGEIEDAAVARNSRGFGMLHFPNTLIAFVLSCLFGLAASNCHLVLLLCHHLTTRYLHHQL